MGVGERVMMEVRTKDLLLKGYDEIMAAECHDNFLCQKETAKHTLWKPTESVQEAKEKLFRWTKDLKKNDIFWIVIEAKSGKAIGFVCVEEIGPKIYGNVGIAIGQEFVKKGYGSQVLFAVIDLIKSREGKEIHYSHFEENVASGLLAKKFGFEYYKQAPRVRRYDNKTFNELFYVLKLD